MLLIVTNKYIVEFGGGLIVSDKLNFVHEKQKVCKFAVVQRRNCTQLKKLNCLYVFKNGEMRTRITSGNSTANVNITTYFSVDEIHIL